MVKLKIIKMTDFTQGMDTKEFLYLRANPLINYKDAKDLQIEVPPTHKVKVTFGGSVRNVDSGITKVFDNKNEAKLIKQGSTFSIAYLPKHRFISLTWWTPDSFDFIDCKTLIPIKIGASGKAEVRLVDPDLFFASMVGDMPKYTVNDFEKWILSEIGRRFRELFANTINSDKIPCTEFVLRQGEIGDAICKSLNFNLLNKYGIEFSSFIIDRFSIDGMEKIIAFSQESADSKQHFSHESFRKEKERLDDKEWERKKYLLEMEQLDRECQYDVMKSTLGQNNGKAVTNVCSQCGNPINPSQSFCNVCGARLKVVLACSCGMVNKMGSAFCAKCGKKL